MKDKLKKLKDWYAFYGYYLFWILLHPSNILFFTIIVSSILLIISTNSWLITWVALEINLILFIPLILKKNNKYQREAALKYFIVQATASILILIRLFRIKITHNIRISLITISLIIKIAAAPFHQWMPSIIQGLRWPATFLLLTLQKVSPLVLISLNVVHFMVIKILFFFITIRALIGAAGGLIQRSLQKILAYSSISHLSWILRRILININMWISYFIVYSLLIYTIVFSFYYFKIYYLSHLFNNNFILNTLISITFLSLGGLPPFSGFFPKLIVVNLIIESSNPVLLLPIISGTLIRLFFYLRVVFKNLFISLRINIKNKKQNKNSHIVFLLNIIIIITGYLILLIILNFKLYKTKSLQSFKKESFLSLIIFSGFILNSQIITQSK